MRRLHQSITGRDTEAIGRLQQQETGAVVNWCGTYEDVAQRLLRRWELELQWNQ